MEFTMSTTLCSMSGNLLLGGCLAFSLGGMLLCLGPGREGRETQVRILTLATAFLAALAGGEFWGLIFADRFDIAYIAGYSAQELPVFYKVSVFWAGQQGSFLLWLLIHALTGGMIAWRGQMGMPALGIYLLLESLLVVLVLAQSPFSPAEAVMADGVGLNPLLQDPWMVVHPPIIFVGYALLAVPLSFSTGSLLEGPENRAWLVPARRWALVAWAFLGAGIFIGGYWAYKVLGWGGYWGWDPVENSSLVPWLLTLVFVHVLKVAQVRQGSMAMVHLAAIFAFSLVLYGSFLTRSGLLGDFSVHAFSGTSLGLTLALVNALVLLGTLLVLTVRAGRLPQGAMYESWNSREFLVLLGMLLAVFVAVIVFLGMSMPLFTQLLGHPAAVDTSFYVRTTLPLAIGLMAAMAFASLRCYGQEKILSVRWLGIALALGIAVPLAAGVREVLPLLLSGTALMGAAASYAGWRRRILGTGGLIAHGGVGLALVAIVLSGNGSRTEMQEFSPAVPYDLMGHVIAYQGQEFLADGTAKYYIYTVDGRECQALTKLRPNGADAAREPAIVRDWAGDVYIAPSPPEGYGIKELTLQLRAVSMDGELAYRFDEAVYMPSSAGMDGRVTARVAVTDGESVEECSLEMELTESGTVSQPVEILAGKKRLRLTGITEDRHRLRIEILPSQQEMASVPVTATVSTKPFIWGLWLGCCLVTLGCLAAIRKRDEKIKNIG